MPKNRKRYITQLTSQELDDILAAANIHAGDGIEINKTEDGIEVSIDKIQLTRWVRILIQGGKIQ